MDEQNKKLIILRNEYELTQAQFGEKIGVSRGHVAALESGKYKPSKQLLKKVLSEFNITQSAFNLSIEDFVEEMKMINPEHKWMEYPSKLETELQKEVKKQAEMIELLRENNAMLKEKIKLLESQISKSSK